MDGVDLVHAIFRVADGTWSFETAAAQTLPFTPEWQKRLAEISRLSGEELLIADLDFGRWLAEITNDFITRNSIVVDLIASHGHTVFHQPGRKLTYQIGSGSVIAAETKLTVVNDFRTLDVAVGGQGAPLVPIGDRLLFGGFDFCLNLGGIANLSYDHGNQRVAMDICPANTVLNHLARRMELNYDHQGMLASKGRLDAGLLKRLNELAYYALPAPKSIGREWIEQEVLAILDLHPGTVPDLLCTFAHHVAFQIAAVVNAEIEMESRNRPRRLLATGGGAYNVFLIELLHELTEAEIVVPESVIVEFKEALVFAFMGVLRVRNEINCYKSVTGALADSSLGQVWATNLK